MQCLDDGDKSPEQGLLSLSTGSIETINQIKAMLVAGPETLRVKYRWLTTAKLLNALAATRAHRTYHGDRINGRAAADAGETVQVS